MTVLSIIGAPRSGTTVMGMYASQGNAIYLGEVDSLWANRPVVCNCGKSPEECDFWGEFVAAAGENPDLITYAHRLVDFIQQTIGANAAWCHTSKSIEFCETLIQVANQKGHANRVAHIVRDPRGIALSVHRGWRKRKDDGAEPSLKTLVKTAVSWNRINAAIETRIYPLAPTASFSYQSIASEPDSQHAFLDFLMLDYDGTLRHQHALGGNPSRKTSQLVFRPDVEWVSRISAFRQAVSYFFALPTSKAYGIPFFK